MSNSIGKVPDWNLTSPTHYDICVYHIFWQNRKWKRRGRPLHFRNTHSLRRTLYYSWYQRSIISPCLCFQSFRQNHVSCHAFRLFHSLRFLPVFLSFLNGLLPRNNKRKLQASHEELSPDAFTYNVIPKCSKSVPCDPVSKGDYTFTNKEDVVIMYKDKLISLKSVTSKETVL